MKHFITDNNEFLADGVTPNPDFGQTMELYIPDAPAVPPSWDALTFKRRFTSQERITIRAAAASSGAVYDFLDLLDTAAATGTRIHANDPDVVGGLTAFENAGLISSGRAAVILSAAASP